MIRHVVLWTMEEERRHELDDLLIELRELPRKIKEIVALTAGRPLNESPLDAALCVDVSDLDALRRYREHPEHRPVLQHLLEVASEVVVADYEF
jgi:hypothetical protein